MGILGFWLFRENFVCWLGGSFLVWLFGVVLFWVCDGFVRLKFSFWSFLWVFVWIVVFLLFLAEFLHGFLCSSDKI